MPDISITLRTHRHPILFAFIIVAIAILGAVTMQYLAALVLIGIVAIFALAFRYLDTHGPENHEQDAWFMIASGVIVAVVAAGTPWLLWAVAFAVLFLIFLVLSRIEKQLAALEEQGTRRVLRRRTRGVGPRHRA